MFFDQFLRRWLIANILGWLMGFMIIIFLALLIEAIGIGPYQFFVGIGMGVGVGFMQGRLMMFYFSIGYEWMASTIIGVGLSFIIIDLLHYLSILTNEYNLLYSVGLGGLLTGVIQYLILKRQFIRAIIWLPISTIGWLAAGCLVRFTEVLNDFGVTGLPAAILVLVILTIGASSALGLTTGLALKKIIG